MIASITGSNSLDSKILYTGKQRSYTVNLVDGETKGHNFTYKEKDIREYVFDDAIALSGSRTHHFFGILKDKKYFFQDWSKGNRSARTDSDFWINLPVKDLGTEVDFSIEDKSVVKFDHPVNLLFSINAYWHWFMEDLPLFKYLRLNDHKIITNKLTSWQKESIAFFPDIESRIVEVDTPCVVDAPEYHVFSKPDGGAGRNCEWVSHFLKQNFKPTTNSVADKKIYISRNDAEARAVDNEDEVKNFLSEQGFEIIESFSKVGLQEKIDLFSQSKLVVCPTGANLCHVYAMPSKSKVIDFNHKFLLTDEHWYNNIGSANNLEWTTIGAVTGSRNKRPRERNRNLILNTKVLGGIIAQ